MLCRNFAPLSTTDVVEDILLNESTVLHAGDRAIVAKTQRRAHDDQAIVRSILTNGQPCTTVLSQ